MDKCKTTCEYLYFPKEGAPNEQGWKCHICGDKPGEPAGFSPTLDRSLTGRKVSGIHMDLHNDGYCHFSSGSEGDDIANQVTVRCVDENVYDQYSIIQWTFEALTRNREGGGGHRHYWARVSRGVLSGHDPRSRCYCGQLSTWWAQKEGQHFRGCGKHMKHNDFTEIREEK